MAAGGKANRNERLGRHSTQSGEKFKKKCELTPSHKIIIFYREIWDKTESDRPTVPAEGHEQIQSGGTRGVRRRKKLKKIHSVFTQKQ